MRQQKVSVDVVRMVTSSAGYLLVAAAAWLLVKLVCACFWLPGELRREGATAAASQREARHLRPSTKRQSRQSRSCDVEEPGGLRRRPRRWRKRRRKRRRGATSRPPTAPPTHRKAKLLCRRVCSYLPRSSAAVW
ncbi:uncharacterized protein LOC126215311 [Schistocerca nitens]|uniref:uncharacterized protein LOC126215311 n=1 Tax=Schistocerca nitens TaxID=7011 RepID=UPI002118D528|nr:uncharacterized protein LOC126215311 [Schistocerca nitens]